MMQASTKEPEMSAMMDTLLADTRHMEAAAQRRDDCQIAKVMRVAEPVTRADKIIAACSQARTKYRAMNPTADTAMVYGEQIGMLHGEVRRLCDELAAFDNPTAAPAGEAWDYIDLQADADLGNTMVRCFYDTDSGGDGDLMAVYLSGTELARDTLSDLAWESLERALSDEIIFNAEANAIAAIFDRGAL